MIKSLKTEIKTEEDAYQRLDNENKSLKEQNEGLNKKIFFLKALKEISKKNEIKTMDLENSK